MSVEEDQWLDLGRDAAMEELLLRSILEGAGIAFEPAADTAS